MRNLYTTLRKYAETLEYLEDLFFPLLLAGDAPMELPPGLHQAHKPFLVVHQLLLRVLREYIEPRQIVPQRISYDRTSRLDNTAMPGDDKMARNMYRGHTPHDQTRKGSPTEQPAPEALAPPGRRLFVEVFGLCPILLRPRVLLVDPTTFTFETFAERSLRGLR